MIGKCCIKNCKKNLEIIYLDKSLCWDHWLTLCEKQENERDKGYNNKI